VAEHRDRVLSLLPTSRRTVTVPADQAFGRVLAEDVTAVEPVPRFDNSAMDGYAVRSSDLTAGTRLRVVGESKAGTPPTAPVRAGEAVRIMTGAIIPDGADTVVPLEQTDDGREQVVIMDPPSPGRHVRYAGEDMAVGALVIAAGTVLDAIAVSSVASTGTGECRVFERPRVAVITTGAELRPPGSPLGAAQIPESNSLLIAGLLAEAGAEVVLRLSVGDEASGLLDGFAQAKSAEADLVVLSGGVSVGDYDVVHTSLSGELEFVGVQMAPGRPQACGVIDSMPVIAVPGNPVAAAVSVEAFARPAVLTLAGRDRIDRTEIIATAGADWRSKSDREQYTAVRYETTDAGLRVTPLTQGSHRVGSLGAMQAWAVVPVGTDQVREGDRVRTLLVR